MPIFNESHEPPPKIYIYMYQHFLCSRHLINKTLSQTDVKLAENIRLIYQYTSPNKTKPNMHYKSQSDTYINPVDAIQIAIEIWKLKVKNSIIMKPV